MDAGDGDGPPLDATEETTPHPPAPPAVATPASTSGEKPVKRMMKTPYQLEVLEQTYLAEQYPSEAMRAELSVKIGLSDRQLQMWFCHRRLKDRRPPAKRQRDEDAPALLPLSAPPLLAPQQVLPLQAMPLASSDLMMTAGTSYDEPLPPTHPRRGAGRSSAVPRISAPDIGRRFYEPLSVMLPPPVPLMQFESRQAELRVITSVESQLGEPLREDGPMLGADFDPLPPGAFGAPIVPEQQKQSVQSYGAKIFSRHDPNLLKVSSFLPSMEHPFVPNSFAGKRKTTVGNPPQVHPHGGSRAVHEYQFLPEQPSDTYERASRSHYYDTPVEASTSRIPSFTPGSHLLHGSEEMAPGYAFEGQGLLPQSGRPLVFPAVLTDYEMNQSNSNVHPVPVDGQFGSSQVAGFEDPLVSSETRSYHDEDASRVDRKRKHNEEAKIAKEVEAHEKRIRKELEKQDILRRKREEQMRKEMERVDRERKKEEERLLRERQREEERFQREQRREHERMEKFLQKQSRRAEKQRQKEELRKEKEMARQKAANERATARRIAREYTELVEDERLELMELAAQSKGLPSMLCLDSDTLQQLDSFRGMLSQFPPEMVKLKVPLSIKPWTESEESVGKLLMVWKFLITFADVLELSAVTLDEFVQSLHDYDSRLLGELHVALLKSIIKDIEDVARTPSVALGVNPGGGHPQIVEGAYSWGFNIRDWQRHLNLLTWPEILRQFALSAGFGPQLKKRNADDIFYRDENEGQDGQNVISTLRNGSAAACAAALMKERGYTHRRSRHRLTPGTVKFAAFHVLSLEDSSGLTILEVAEKIQKSGLRDLTTSKTPEASIAAALSRDMKLFERTAPSTYCVKSPYRKDPADSEAVLSAAREKIRAFQNVLSDSEAEKEVDDVDRDEESDCDDDPDGDDVNTEVGDEKDLLAVKAQGVVPTAAKVSVIIGEPDSLDTALTRPISSTTSRKDVPMLFLGDSSAVGTSSVSPLRASSDHHEVITGDAEDTEIDESNQGESWVQGLGEGDYCDLSVEERLNALVALVGVATEGNSIRAVLEERLEAANAIKKQMWAEAQLDKRRSKEEFASRSQYNSYTSLKADAIPEHNATETTPTPVRNLNIDNDEMVGALNNSEILNQQSQSNAGNVSYERNGVAQEISATPDNLSAQQYASADKTRSQLKSYIGHRAEQLYVYRSLPLGQDRRRNQYWQFSTSTSPNDPGSGRIFFESREGYWRVIDSEEIEMAENGEAYDPKKDPKRRAKSKDPGWKYAYWPTENTNVVECLLCGKIMSSGIKRAKQHLAGGYGDVLVCEKVTSEIMREIQAYIEKKRRKTPLKLDSSSEEEGGDQGDDEVQEVVGVGQLTSQASCTGSEATKESTPTPSSGTASKKRAAAAFFKPAPTKQLKIAPLLLKTPEELVRLRHAPGAKQQLSLYRCGKSDAERHVAVKYICKFLYDNAIAFNVVNSRSFEEMVEAIGQYGHGLKPPSYHEASDKYIKEAVNDLAGMRKKHELAWKTYGCTLMSDAWTDRKQRHLVNFLVNSPEGTFFLGSVNASSETHDAAYLAGLLGQKIEEIGVDNVVQICTDNGSNYKAAGRLLMEKYSKLYWTPCAAHCLDLMLEDIAKIQRFKEWIVKAKRVTTFVYRHLKLLDKMREYTGGNELVRPAATRFATTFYTLQSMHKNKEALRKLFVSDYWTKNKLAKTETGKHVYEVVMSMTFWNVVEDCIRASHPVLIVLRLVDGDENPTMPQLTAAMEICKNKLNESFSRKPPLLEKLMQIFRKRWDDQMMQKLHGAALFLNPGRFFDIQENDPDYAQSLRMTFNQVATKMVDGDEEMIATIDVLADDYQQVRGDCFDTKIAINGRKRKSPLDWWKSNGGGQALPLTKVARRIVGLCTSASACERNWSTFERIHSKKRSKLGHPKLDDLSYISFNSKIQERFARLHHEGNKVNPLFLEEFQWDNEWVDKDAEVVQRVHEEDDLTWDQVDAAATTSSSLLRRNQPRGAPSGGNVYTRVRPAPEIVDELDEDPFICDDEDVDDDVVGTVGTEGSQSQPDGGEDNEVDGENSNDLEYDDDDV